MVVGVDKLRRKRTSEHDICSVVMEGLGQSMPLGVDNAIDH